MSEFPKTISGYVYLAANLASGGNVAVPYPTGTTRDDWAAVDLATAQIAVSDQDTYKSPGISLALGATLTITNSSGVLWKAGAKLTVSAVRPVLGLQGLPQANYDALITKDPNTVYVTTSS